MPFIIEFYPAEGDRHSPYDILLAQCETNDQIHINKKLEHLGDLPQKEWVNTKWLKIIEGMYQIRQGNFRVYFQTHNNLIIVCHICRKRSKDTKIKDIYSAQNNIKK